MSYRNLYVCAAALGAAAFGTSAAAGDWQVEPRLEIAGVYDDNYNLNPEGIGEQIEVSGGEVDLAVALRNVGPRSLLEFTPRITSDYFADARDEESTDYFGGLRWQLRTQRSQIDLNTAYSRESVTKSELIGADDPDGGLGVPGAGDSGRITTRSERSQLQVIPTYQLDMTERTQLELGARYLDADYEVNEAGGYVDYQDISGSIGIGYKLSERDAVKVRVVASRFEPETNFITERLGAEVEWRRKTGESMEMYLRGGAKRSEFSAGGGGEATGFVGGAGAIWKMQVSQVMLDLIRSVEPSSVGRVIDRDELRLRVERRLSERFSLLGSARALRTRSSFAESNEVDDNDRDSASASAGFEWRVRRTLSFAGQYEYQWQEFEVDPTDATSNGVRLGIVYEPQRRAE